LLFGRSERGFEKKRVLADNIKGGNLLALRGKKRRGARSDRVREIEKKRKRTENKLLTVTHNATSREGNAFFYLGRLRREKRGGKNQMNCRLGVIKGGFGRKGRRVRAIMKISE